MLPAFILWLKDKPYSEHTKRNYLVDIRKFLTWLGQQPNSKLSQKLLTGYLQLICQQNSYSRQLASLRLFCQFAQDQNLISSDLLSASLKALSVHGNSEISSQPSFLAEYSHWLKLQKASPATIKNYLSDLNDYLNWLHA